MITSCTRSSIICRPYWRGAPWASCAYPRARAFSTASPISSGRTCVRTRFVMSKRVVPSLKTWIACFARRRPFSRGSGVFEREIMPWTAFTPAGRDDIPTRAIAASTASRSGIDCFIARFRGSVNPPHVQRGRNHRFPHVPHTRVGGRELAPVRRLDERPRPEPGPGGLDSKAREEGGAMRLDRELGAADPMPRAGGGQGGVFFLVPLGGGGGL